MGYRRNTTCLGGALTLAALLLPGCSSPTAPTAPTSTSSQQVAWVVVSGPVPAVGMTTQFTATAVLSDGAKVDVTSQAAWSSSNPGVLSVSATGMITGVSTGTSVLSAVYGSVTGSTPVAVTAVPCTFALEPDSVSLPAAGGTATITVTPSPVGSGMCPWTARSNDAFLSIVNGDHGSDKGTVTFSAMSNGGTGRAGSLTVAGRTVAVTQGQAACVSRLSGPTDIPVSGGMFSATVAATEGCAWTATAGGVASITGNASGVGSGSVTFTVKPNAEGVSRQGWLRVDALELSVTQAAIAGTFLSFISDEGDWVGRGQDFVAIWPAAIFTAEIESPLNNLNVRVRQNYGEYWWSLQLRAPYGAQLAPGTYLNATRFPFQASGAPGLNFDGNGRGCNQLSGSFTILDIAFGPNGTVTRVYATFEQHCENSAPAVRGAIRIG